MHLARCFYPLLLLKAHSALTRITDLDRVAKSLNLFAKHHPRSALVSLLRAFLFITRQLFAENLNRFGDVRKVNVLQLESLGITAEQIAIAPYCTYQTPEYFFSYRREQQKKIQWSGIVM